MFEIDLDVISSIAYGVAAIIIAVRYREQRETIYPTAFVLLGLLSFVSAILDALSAGFILVRTALNLVSFLIAITVLWRRIVQYYRGSGR